MEKYIGDHIVMPVKYYIPVLTKVIERKIEHPSNSFED